MLCRLQRDLLIGLFHRSPAPLTSAARQRVALRSRALTKCRATFDNEPAKGNVTLFDTLTRRKQILQPQGIDKSVSMYVCGVTVYDFSHIGHARVYVSFDLLFRYLKHKGYKVQYVRNFTDIDDKIIARAKERKESTAELSERFIEEFHVDMQSLNCLPPTGEPRATDHIQDMIADIEKIIGNGHGYEAGGDVYFDISTFPAYGGLSGRDQGDNRPGERVAVDGRKRNAADFVLWKAAKADEPKWNSPWGAGRPGWHIECSAMIRTLLGNRIDIHGGGRDLVFPHHENEIAQAAAAEGLCSCCTPQAGQNLAKHWVHNGFVNVDSEKMSKSLGNFFTIRDVLAIYHPLALRYFLLSAHYRSGINYSTASLDAASERLYYLFQSMVDCQAALDSNSDCSPDEEISSLATSLMTKVTAGLDDDLNTQPAIALLSEATKSINQFCNSKQGKRAKGREQQLAGLYEGIRSVLELLGMWQGTPQAVLKEMRSKWLLKNSLTEADIQTAIERRQEARQAKDFQAADKVRLDFAAKGIQIMDTPEGTTWRPQFETSN